jgi:hypothetical protein
MVLLLLLFLPAESLPCTPTAAAAAAKTAAAGAFFVAAACELCCSHMQHRSKASVRIASSARRSYALLV